MPSKLLISLKNVNVEALFATERHFPYDSPVMSDGIPHITAYRVIVDGEPWEIHTPEEYISLLPLFSFPTKPLKPLFERVTIRGVPLLLGFLPQERKILVASVNAARELFIVQETESEELKAHVSQLQSIDSKNSPSDWEEITRKYQLPDFFRATNQSTEQQESTFVDMLTHHVRTYRSGIVERMSDLFLRLAVRYPVMRVHVLKLIAALPSLDHDQKGCEVKRLFLETMRRLRPLPLHLFLIVQGKRFFVWCLPARMAAWAVRYSVKFFAKRFIAGETIDASATTLQALRDTHRTATVDQLGELVVSEKEADDYMSHVLQVIEGLSRQIPRGKKNAANILEANVSVKVSALTHAFKPEAPEETYQAVRPRLLKILLTAKEHDVFVTIDAEHFSVRDLTFFILKSILLETPELQDAANIGVVLQAYLKDAYLHFLEIFDLAKRRKISLPIRLVKGAYWDEETIDAEAHNFASFHFLNKEETDLHFRQLIIKILEASPHVQLCLGSHNLRDHCFAQSVRVTQFSNALPIEHQCLHGTCEALSVGMTKMGWSVRNYIPVGSLLVGMAYLVRRIMENSSQVGFLTALRTQMDEAMHVSASEFHRQKIKSQTLVRDSTVTDLTAEFRNATPAQLFLEKERTDFLKILRSITLPLDSIRLSTAHDVMHALDQAATEAKNGAWPKLSAVQRATILLKAATLLLVKRFELASLIVLEGAKTPTEALADVDEAIDFLNFYARTAVDSSRSQKVIPRGIVAAIAPWNFPIAIPCGMISAALATGNTVLFKSAEHTPRIAQKLVDMLHEAGVPRSALIHLPGTGKEVGARLVEAPRVDAVAFTGSKEVGLWIADTAGKRLSHPPQFSEASVPTKVITEMGGKNAIIVTQNAELDETISGVLYSAFGNAGQKCSAASRVLVDVAVRDRFVERFTEACRDLCVGLATSLVTDMNPLIGPGEKKKILEATKNAIEEAHRFGGKVLVDRTAEPLPGNCVGPLVIELPAKRARDPESFASQELFGPILHVMTYTTLDEALDIANATDYALTGGIFSQSQDDIDYLVARFQAGNIYVNRHITGARVSIEPFGGFKHSGTGPKAGSEHYIEAFQLNVQNLTVQDTAHNGAAKEFSSWLDRTVSTYLSSPHPHRKIPGQESYDDYSLIRQKGVVFGFRKNIAAHTLFSFLSAAKLGSTMIVYAANEEAARAWSEIAVTYAPDVSVVETECLKNIQAMVTDASFIIVDGTVDHIATVFPLLHACSHQGSEVRTIITPFDTPAGSSRESYISPYIHVRSLAINTMRYGAPLEL